MLIEVSLAALAFLFSPSTVGGWIAGKVFDAMLKTTRRRIDFLLEPDVGRMQDFLFGIRTGGLPPSNGINRWQSMEDPNTYFGETTSGGYPAPPYDLTGLREVAHLLPGGWEAFLRQDDNLIVNVEANLLFIGGKINPRLEEIRRSVPVKFPIDFIDVNKIPVRHRPGNQPGSILRYFTDNSGQSYSRISKANRLLVDRTDLTQPPVGPFITSDGQIESDVILLSVIPAPNGKRAILVQPGYGAGSRLAEILFSPEIVSKLYREISNEAYPWFQAAFFVPVEYSGYHEQYGIPELRFIRPLGQI